MNSMTGYGKGDEKKLGIRVVVELSSYNRKNFDIKSKMPVELYPVEITLKKILSEKLFRGSVNMNVAIELEPELAAAKVKLNKTLINHYISELSQVTRNPNISADIKISDIINLPGIIIEDKTSLQTDTLFKLADSAVKKALQNLLLMRQTEGYETCNDLKKRREILICILNEIKETAPEIPKKQKKRLIERIKSLDLEIKKDDFALEREIAFFADRCDISEEITRLDTHLKHMNLLFDENGPLARRLDFLIQEMNREINTIGSKANDTTLSHCVVEFKSELERIREQIQNIE